LWDEVKDILKKSALSLSGGSSSVYVLRVRLQFQPEVILMGEPASALDPIATLKIEKN
jgi:phosphate transport system ATP-binding protein